MVKKVKNYILIGQAGFLICLGLCIYLLPKGLWVNDGISYFGGHAITRWPAIIGTIWLAGSYVIAIHQMPKVSELKAVNQLIYLTIFFIGLSFAIPFNHNTLFHTWHLALSVIFMGLQIFTALWLVIVVRWDNLNALLLLALSLLVFLNMTALEPDNGFLLQAEVAFQLIFSWLFVRSVTSVQPFLTNKKQHPTPLVVSKS